MPVDLEKHMQDVRLANMIFFTLGLDFVEESQIMNEFNVDSKTAQQSLVAMARLGILRGMQVGEKIVFQVMITSFSQLQQSFIDKLKTLGKYSDQQLIARIEPDDSEKAEYSPILDDDKWNWHESSVETPNEDKLLYIRIRNDFNTLKSKTTKTFVEDSRLARWKNGEFVLEPPYTKYDFSPLTDRDKFKEGAIVTHWAYASEEDLDMWKKRFEFIHGYDELVLKVDEYNEEEVYDALVLAAAALSSALQNCKEGDPMIEKLDNAHMIICDLQSCIDQNQPEVQNAMGKE